MSDIKILIERLLGRPLIKTEGVKLSEIDKIELKLGYSLPQSLKDLYLLAGKNVMLLESFNRFALPSQLQLSDDKIVFLEENQEVCYWGFTAREENPVVYMLFNEGEWHSEKVRLDEFLSIILYYQCAQGGYEFGGVSHITKEDLEIFIHTEWEDVVRHNGLQIYWKPDCLLWYLYDYENDIIDSLYFSARTQEAYDAHAKKYELEEL